MIVLGYLFFVAVSVSSVQASCPDSDTELRKWSESSSWINGEPAENEDVTITSKILLDTSPGIDLGGITIVPGGQLVFAQGQDITLRAHYIDIKGGRLDIGSEDCLFTGKATIQLLGTINDTYSVPGFGRKFIGVDSNGTLEIHGKKKLPWTKLTSTLEKLTPDAFTLKDTIDKSNDSVRGLIVYSINPSTGEADKERGEFHIGGGSQTWVDKRTKEFIDYVNGVPDGHIIMMGVRKYIVDHKGRFDRTELYEAVETLGYGKVTNTSKIRDLVFYDGFAMIVVKGDTSKTIEVFEPYIVGGLHQTSTATLIDEENQFKYFVSSYTSLHGFGKSSVKFEVTHTDYSVPTLSMTDDVTSWEAGDKVFLSSTDYDWEQVEIGTVVDCSACENNQVRVDITSNFTHYGEILDNVDMRAEVALLSRNIVIEGVMEKNGNGFGGHIKVLKGFKDFHIEGAELRHMGQSTSIGNYPIHWHICEDVDDISTYPNPTYAKENSIHSTYARCVTVHATHGATIADNVCFDSIGHGYFLEDGGEKRTTLKGNIGASQTRGSLVPTDKNPATFWISNPQTSMENNVAAGSQGNGIWYIFPEEPMGTSKGKGYMAPDEARHTALKHFYNNVAHSNKVTGLLLDGKLDENGYATATNEYQPLNDPLDLESGDKKVTINKLTVYKNSVSNARIRGGLIEVTDSSFSDSPVGLIFQRYHSGGQSVLNSVFVGDSENKGIPQNGLDRSLPISLFEPSPKQGLVFGSGTTVADNIWFNGFANTSEYGAGAIGFNPDNLFLSSPRNRLTNVGFGFNDFAGGNRVLQSIGTVTKDGNRVDIFHDESGDVTSIPGASVVRASPFQMTSNCLVRANWKMAVCDERFAQVIVRGMDNTVTMIRNDNMTTNRETSDTHGVAPFNVVLGKSYKYLLKLDSGLPKSWFGVHHYGIPEKQSVVVGVCVPKDLTFRILIVPYVKRASEVDSLAEVESDENEGVYYFDREVGVVFLKLVNTESSNPDSVKCPMEKLGLCCGFVFVRLSTSDWSDTDCVAAYAAKYGASSSVTRHAHNQARGFRRSISLPEELSFTSAHPPTNVGAGSTRG